MEQLVNDSKFLSIEPLKLLAPEGRWYVEPTYLLACKMRPSCGRGNSTTISASPTSLVMPINHCSSSSISVC